jgi:hypothetical protein
VRLTIGSVVFLVALMGCLSPVGEDPQGMRVPLPDGGFDLVCGDGGTYGLAIDQILRKGQPPVFSESCTVIRGNLSLWGEDDFNPYRRVRTVEGRLFLGDYPSKPLEFTALSNLKSVHGLTVSNTLGMVTSLDGLQLEGVYGEGINIYQARGLADLKALKNTNVRGGDLLVLSTDKLQSLEGLEGVTQLRSLRISNNAALESLTGLSNLKRVDQDVDLTANPKLTGIDEFLRRVEVGGTVSR